MFRYLSSFLLFLLTYSNSISSAFLAKNQQVTPSIDLSDYSARICPGSSTTIDIAISGQLPIQITYITLENGEQFEHWVESETTPLALELSSAGDYQIINYGNRNIQIDTSIDFSVKDVHFPTADLLGGGIFCENEPIEPIEIMLSGTPPWELTYQENNGNAQLLNISETRHLISNNEGVINIRNIKDKYCSKEVMDTAFIKIYEIPEVSPIEGEQELCPGWDAIYQTSYSNKYVYDWHIPTGGNINTGVKHTANQIPVKWTKTGTYYLYLVVSSPNTGCNTGKITYPVEVFSPPIVKEGFDTVACFETDVYIELSPAQKPENSIFWPHLEESAKSVSIYDEGWYYYFESIPLGCTDTGSIRVVDKCIPEVYVPEAFTPNNDQINDKLEVFGVFYNLELHIYNLNGELIHVMKNTNAPWDGTKNGQEMPNGTYIWKATFTDKFEENYSSEGHVILIR